MNLMRVKLQLMRKARAKSRGYADFWEWSIDRKRTEAQAARILCNFLAQSGGRMLGVLSHIASDPPDILLNTADGRQIGIEVTELVNADTVKRHRYLKKHGHEMTSDCANWTAATVACELRKLVRVKDHKLARATGMYHELLLAIITDEPLINQTLATTAVALHKPVVERIGRAFLILSYDPSADEQVYPNGYPIFPIPLQASKL